MNESLKAELLEEVKLLKEEYECFSFILEEDKNKGIVVMVVDYGEGKEYLIEGNIIVDGGFEPCLESNYSCEFGDYEEFINEVDKVIKELLS